MPLADPTPAAVAALAPTGVLRAAINLSNFLLVTGRDDDGTPTGVSPDMARELARRLGVDVDLRPYRSPGELADDAVNDAWDIGNIGAEPARAETIAFTAAYCEIECTYLVAAGLADHVRRGGRPARPAHRLGPTRRLRPVARAQPAPRRARPLARRSAARSSCSSTQRLDALAGLRPALLGDAERLPGSRVLDGQFSSVQQAMGTPRGRDEAGFAYLRRVRRGDEGQRLRRRPHRRPRRRRPERGPAPLPRPLTGLVRIPVR